MSEGTSSNFGVNRLRNFVIGIVAIALSLTLVLGLQTSVNSESLEAQAQGATPLEVALNNGKPTLMEFYANWCTSCQAMAGDMATLKQEYGNDVNFVMLNVDNTKWLPEVLNYQVDGIPHFVFLNEGGSAIASAIGEQPLSIFEQNLTALVSNNPLPYANSQGVTSQIETSNPVVDGNQDNPRDHSN
ncbi:thioredoxin family protein [Cyanobacterium sp. IPPAS B-1200]|uniref:thioredoxin family protein n=1 Tax=Cyanobacterium sp. IPPAS B-1200 TaxID=1562720 RepID=UPI0008525B66|nr:thioredoxin family protein [Cyanobacterium sp. IPPAS B-1200]OEJ78593.1 thiol:disulfide interchange protein [Cyanobacterium sp. IPPAS B-1200]